MKQIYTKRTIAFLMALTLCGGTLAGCGDTDSSSAAETTAATTTTAAESAAPAESAADNSSEEEALEEGIEELDEKAEDAGDDIDVDEYIANILDDGAEPGEEVTPVADDNIDEDEISRSNSNFVEYTKISPNRTTPRNHKIDTITIHCMAGQLSVETCGKVFETSKAQASSNYGVGKDGRIGLYVEEKDRSWCSSNSANDNRAVTIEVASDSFATYAVSDEAYKATIRLVADICERNGIKKLVWSTDKNERINHTNGANMTVHRDFANKACPGDYLYERMGDIADQVNKILEDGTVSEFENVEVPFKVKLVADSVPLIKDPGNDDTVIKDITRLSSNNKVYIYTVSEVKKVDDSLYGKLKGGSGWFDLSYAKLKA